MRTFNWRLSSLGAVALGIAFAGFGVPAWAGDEYKEHKKVESTQREQDEYIGALKEKAACEEKRAEAAIRQLESAKGTGEKQVSVHSNVFFPVDSAELTPELEKNLNSVVTALKETPEAKVRLEGNTDATGSTSYNEELAKKRAEAVSAWLVGQGIDKSRIETESKGETQPLASNETDDGRAMNRRTEIFVESGAAFGGTGEQLEKEEPMKEPEEELKDFDLQKDTEPKEPMFE